MKIKPQDKLYVDIATLMGAGTVPVMPGTFACVLALPFFIFIRSQMIFAVFTLLVTILAFAVCTQAEKALGKKDHKYMVIDDFAGQLITFLFIPFGWKILLGGFFLFRMLDMLKAFPANLMEKKHGALGVVGDDVIAGIYANLVLQVVVHFIFKG